jgi:excisionase family DNA binding protein
MGHQDELTVAEAAEMLGVNRQRVDQLIRQGRLPSQFRGVQRFLPRDAVEAFRSQPKFPGRPKKPERPAGIPLYPDAVPCGPAVIEGKTEPEEYVLDGSHRICATLPVVDRDGRFVRVRLPDGAEIWVRLVEQGAVYREESA